MTIPARLRLAVFIDFDNIEIGVKNTLNVVFDAGVVLEALKERGDVVSKTAYSDWQRAKGYSRMLSQHAIRMVQRNLTPGGDKNGADINLALDALEMAFTHPHINAFVIVAGDSDFISLVEKLKQYDKKVFVVGGRQFTSGILQRNCHEFIAYENLIGAVAPGATDGEPQRGHGRHGVARSRTERASIEQAIPLVTRALKVLSERELVPQLGLLKSTLLQLDSTFSERSYGAGSFRDFVQKLADAGVVALTHSKGSWFVGPADSATPADVTTAADADGVPSLQAPVQSSHQHSEPPERARSTAAPVSRGTPTDALREFRAILGSSAVRRWPMYLRNVQQLLRAANPPLDERLYGFSNVADLLRAAHRDGIVRVDRDRQGVIRVFRGEVGIPQVEPAEVAPAAPFALELPVTGGEPAEPASVDVEQPGVAMVVPPDDVVAPAAPKPSRPRRARGRRSSGRRRSVKTS